MRSAGRRRPGRWGAGPRWRKARRLLALPGLAALGLVLLALPATLEIRPRLVWNASASAPLGLYWAGGKSNVKTGDLVLAELPETMRGLAARRGYLPLSVPLVKRVAALPGDHLCTIGRAILIDGKIVTRQRKRDSEGRILPHWHGCGRLRADEVLLLMAEVPDSFDGRYFGPTRVDQIIGVLTPVWSWPASEP